MPFTLCQQALFFIQAHSELEFKIAMNVKSFSPQCCNPLIYGFWCKLLIMIHFLQRIFRVHIPQSFCPMQFSIVSSFFEALMNKWWTNAHNSSIEHFSNIINLIHAHTRALASRCLHLVLISFRRLWFFLSITLREICLFFFCCCMLYYH